VINRTDNASIGLSYIDVDFFKDINDKHGHQVGDNYLIQIAERLSGIIQRKNSDLVARVGGDEFVIIFTNPTERYIKDTLNYIYCNLTEKYHFGDVSINNPSISIGAVLYRSQNQREVFKEELVRVADLMMYAHKKSKSNSERQRYELGILNR
jgi:diguanylate cyclase